jgi:hypothetical protein
METKALLYDLRTAYGLDLNEDHRKKPASPGDLTVDELTDLLAERVNAMINGDFSTLVQLLYRIDINESRLRLILQENQASNAGQLIARLILERQWQKILTRREYSRRDTGQGTSGKTTDDAPDGEDRW